MKRETIEYIYAFALFYNIFLAWTLSDIKNVASLHNVAGWLCALAFAIIYYKNYKYGRPKL